MRAAKLMRHLSMLRGLPLATLLAIALLPTQAVAISVQFRAAAQASVTNGSVTYPPTTNITYVGTGTLSSVNGANVTPGLPSLYQAGDLLVCLVTRRNRNGVSTPSGWTSLYGNGYTGNADGNFHAAAFWKIATGSEGNSVSFTRAGTGSSGGMRGGCSAFRGVDQTTPIDAGPAAQFRGNSDRIRTGTLTPVTSGVMLLYAAHFNVNTSERTAPSGWTKDYYERSDDRGLALYHRAWDTSQIGDVELRVDSNTDSAGVLIALRPATPSSTPPAGSLTIAKPAGTIENDVMIASIAVTADSTAAVAALGITAPAGWTPVRADYQNQGNGNNNGNRHSRLVTYVRAATAGEPTSYTWSFTGSSHTGAVGGIATFEGVYVNPLAPLDSIDAHAGTATPASRDQTAPSITMSVDDGMLLTVHEFANSRTWSAHTNMDDATKAVDIASQGNGANGISMGMFYESRPDAGQTGTRTARASSNSSADRGATQSIGLKPIPMQCESDNFTRSAPGPDWIVSNSGGSFGNPIIVNNRLRLTDASGNAATMATLQRQFPGAGNRIEIKFDYYAYGGNGADGMAAILSDSAVNPVPGGYGGALGYAPKIENGNHPGFAGGWLGVGIDEFGNFSSTELGKTGGPAQRPDSVAVRGSGAGMTDYRYHEGTATLTPGVDVSGNTPGPGHTYRIIVDHSDAVHAWVSVERRIGSGKWTMLIPSYDAKAKPGQADVPTNWILSFTGSTGGSTNIHEMDNLQVCATRLETLAAVDHYALQHNPNAVNCQPENVTIIARDSNNQTISAEGATIAVTARRVTGTPNGNRGDWILVSGTGTLDNGTADDGVATYTFGANEQQVTLALKNTHLQTVNIDVADGNGVTEASGAGSSEAGYNQNIAFAESGFRITNGANPPAPVNIATQTAGVTSATYALQAIRTDTNTGACVGALANTDTTVELGFQCNDPTTCQGGQLVGINGNTIAANPNSGVANYTGRTLHFDANAQAPFTLVYPDVGRITLHARYNIPLVNGTPSGNYMLGASNAFVVKPYDFELTDIVRTSDSHANPQAINANGAVFARAGEAFSVTAIAVNKQGNATPNYGRETSPESVRLSSALVGGLGLSTNPALTNNTAFGSFSGGAATGTTFAWNEVGIIRLTPEVGDGSYLGAGNVIGTPSDNVGRFIPDHFTLSGGALANRSGAGCAPASAFTYMDEPIALAWSLAASNVGGGTTQNYNGAFAKLNLATPAAHGFGAQDTASGTNLSGRVDVVGVGGSWTNGAASASATVAIARAAAGPDGPYTAVGIGVAPVDGDGVKLAASALDLDTDGNTTNDHQQVGDATDIRFGRLRVQNALGSERLPLPIPMQLEYWNGYTFVVNGDDSCTTLARATIALDGYQGLAACNTAFNLGTISFVNGKATPIPTLTAPSPARGSVDLRVNLGSSASGDYCSSPGGAGNQTAASAAAMSYLLGRWNDPINSGAYDDDPVARAAFGVYGPDRASKHTIYLRENY